MQELEKFWNDLANEIREKNKDRFKNFDWDKVKMHENPAFKMAVEKVKYKREKEEKGETNEQTTTKKTRINS
jgi:hypothetical protein